MNNIIEQDHRYTKARVIASQHFREFWSAKRTISGYESMNMIRKGEGLTLGVSPSACTPRQIKNVNRGDISSQIKFIHSLFGIAV